MDSFEVSKSECKYVCASTALTIMLNEDECDPISIILVVTLTFDNGTKPNLSFISFPHFISVRSIAMKAHYQINAGDISVIRPMVSILSRKFDDGFCQTKQSPCY